MARDPDAIQRDIEKARDELASTLDQLSVRADPKRYIETGKRTVRAKLDDPNVRYVLIGVGALAAIVVVRKLFR